MKPISIYKELFVRNSKLFVWAFMPHRITEQGLISQLGDETPLYRQELADVFAELGLKWKWQPITLENMHAVVEEVAASANEYIPVVLNYCIGDEDTNYPGTCVYKLLEAKGIASTGADFASMELSTSKIRMKRAFIEAGVPTAPYEVIADPSCVQGICDRLGTPLIVKPAMSFESRGLSLQSVVHSDEQLSEQVQRLLSGQHGMQFPPDSIFVERFINGSEFTVFLIGSVHQPESIKIYPPVERVFRSSLPETERFLSYERYHEKCEGETPLSPEAALFHCQQVNPTLHDRLCDLAKRAYCAVDGNGFGRVDVRMDKASQQLFVLEVNPNCDITGDQRSSVGKILHLSGTSFAQLMSEIIAETLARTKASCLSLKG
jgi:D-alanine-D-alanine ligase-like ATP-grasp enzyme